MKRCIAFFVLMVCMSGLAACGQRQTQGEENGQEYFNAIILEVHDTYILVEGLEETSGVVVPGEQAEVSTDLISENSIPDLAVGDSVRVVFNATNDSIPLQVGNVFAIYLLDEAGKPVDS